MKGAGSRPRDGFPDLPTRHPADMPRRTQAAGYRHIGETIRGRFAMTIYCARRSCRHHTAVDLEAFVAEYGDNFAGSSFDALSRCCRCDARHLEISIRVAPSDAPWCGLTALAGVVEPTTSKVPGQGPDRTRQDTYLDLDVSRAIALYRETRPDVSCCPAASTPTTWRATALSTELRALPALRRRDPAPAGLQPSERASGSVPPAAGSSSQPVRTRASASVCPHLESAGRRGRRAAKIERE